MTDKAKTNTSPLLAKEAEVLRCAALGMNAKATGDFMGLSHETVKDYRSNTFEKLGAKNTTHAVAIALSRGYIDMEGTK